MHCLACSAAGLWRCGMLEHYFSLTNYSAAVDIGLDWIACIARLLTLLPVQCVELIDKYMIVVLQCSMILWRCLLCRIFYNIHVLHMTYLFQMVNRSSSWRLWVSAMPRVVPKPFVDESAPRRLLYLIPSSCLDFRHRTGDNTSKTLGHLANLEDTSRLLHTTEHKAASEFRPKASVSILKALAGCCAGKLWSY